MIDCRYCTNFHLNSRESIRDCCMGMGDERSCDFGCNEDLKPETKTNPAANCSVQQMIEELEKRGYTVIKSK